MSTLQALPREVQKLDSRLDLQLYYHVTEHEMDGWAKERLGGHPTIAKALPSSSILTYQAWLIKLLILLH